MAESSNAAALRRITTGRVLRVGIGGVILASLAVAGIAILVSMGMLNGLIFGGVCILGALMLYLGAFRNVAALRLTWQVVLLIFGCMCIVFALGLFSFAERGGGFYLWVVGQGFPYTWWVHSLLLDSYMPDEQVRMYIGQHPEQVRQSIVWSKAWLDAFFAMHAGIILVGGTRFFALRRKAARP